MTLQNLAVSDTKPASAAVERASAEADLYETVLSVLEESKAEDITSIDLGGKTALADHMIVASGRSHRHVTALADHLQRALTDAGHGAPRVEGLPHADWVLLDTGDVIVHLFRPEVRDFYNVEKLWDGDFSGESGTA